MIPYSRQNINQADIEAVIEVLRSEYLTQGPLVPQFEALIASHCGVKHAVAANSATSVLHIACLALGLGPGDWLWTSPNTFVASANCGLYCGASIDFVDIDPKTYNLSPSALGSKLVKAEKEGCLPKVVVPVHFAGQACDMMEIHRLSERYGFKVIEDASHSFGGTYCGESIGNCRYSDITVFSFHPIKIITTGEGGIAVTNDEVLAKKMARLRAHGIVRAQENTFHSSKQGWIYEQVDLGLNYRMNDISAALGISQLKRLAEFLNKRQNVAHGYSTALADLPLKLPYQDPSTGTTWHLYVVQLELPKNSSDRGSLFDYLRTAGIGVNVHYIPVHTHSYFQELGFRKGDFLEAERYYARTLSLPIFPDLSCQTQEYVTGHLIRFFEMA